MTTPKEKTSTCHQIAQASIAGLDITQVARFAYCRGSRTHGTHIDKPGDEYAHSRACDGESLCISIVARHLEQKE